MTVFNRRELRKIVGIDGEELTLDLLPVSSIRIHPVNDINGEWEVKLRIYDQIETVRVANGQYASGVVDMVNEFVLKENERDE